MDTSLIVRSLELIAEKGDPAPDVYARLFAAHPDMEKLFVRDTTGNIRGNMLTEAVTAMLDLIERDNYGGNMMRAEIVNHENLGVPREVFAVFYTTLRDTCAQLLGAAWTKEVAAAWQELLVRIDTALAPQM